MLKMLKSKDAAQGQILSFWYQLTIHARFELNKINQKKGKNAKQLS